MRNLILIIAILITATSCSTMMSGVKAPAETLTFVEVIEVDNKAKNELYLNVNEWFVQTFNSAESVIEYKDKEAGSVMGKYILYTSDDMYRFQIRQTIKVDVKDDKVRITISNAYYKVLSDMLNGSRPYINAGYHVVDSQEAMNILTPEWVEITKSLQYHLLNQSIADW